MMQSHSPRFVAYKTYSDKQSTIFVVLLIVMVNNVIFLSYFHLVSYTKLVVLLSYNQDIFLVFSSYLIHVR